MKDKQFKSFIEWNSSKDFCKIFCVYLTKSVFQLDGKPLKTIQLNTNKFN